MVFIVFPAFPADKSNAIECSTHCSVIEWIQIEQTITVLEREDQNEREHGDLFYIVSQ